MAIFTAVADSALSTFLSEYGLVLASFGGIAEGSVNSNYWVEGKSTDDPHGAPRRLFLRVYEEQDATGARAEAELLRTLAAGGVPTPSPVANASGQTVGTLSAKPAALFPWRAGRMRCQASVSAADVRQLGASLARMHGVAAGPHNPGRFRRADLELRLDSIARATAGRLLHDAADCARLSDPALLALATSLRARLAEVDDARTSGLPAGLVHGDLFRDNVLFGDDGTLIALLDFESAFSGAFVFDLAVCFLAWTYGDDFDLGLGRAMVAGYESERRLEPSERRAFLAEAKFAALRFTITRVTDFTMRAGSGPSSDRVMKDYRRFLARFERLIELGPAKLASALFGEETST